MPRRLLIAAGFLLIGAGLMLMRGLDAGVRLDAPAAGDDRRRSRRRPGEHAAHLDRGRRRRARPRRHGIGHQLDAAAGRRRDRRRRLGTILASHVRTSVVDTLCGDAAYRARTDARRTRSRPAAPPQAIASTPAAAARPVADDRAPSFVDGLNTILLVAALVAFAAAVVSFALIRERDFVGDRGGGRARPELAVAA